jgi:hypothetical protein
MPSRCPPARGKRKPPMPDVRPKRDSAERSAKGSIKRPRARGPTDLVVRRGFPFLNPPPWQTSRCQTAEEVCASLMVGRFTLGTRQLVCRNKINAAPPSTALRPKQRSHNISLHCGGYELCLIPLYILIYACDGHFFRLRRLAYIAFAQFVSEPKLATINKD